LDKQLIPREVEIEPGFLVDTQNTQELVNSAGIRMVRYVYFVIKTNDGEYKIGNMNEYKRIISAVNSNKIRFVRIGSDLVNISIIRSIKKHTNHITFEEYNKLINKPKKK